MLILSRENIELLKFPILLFVLFLFSSCLTIESDMKLNSNGSGQIKISYIMDLGLRGISTLDSDDEIVPLNLSEEYISGIVNSRDDVAYRDYNISSDERYYRVNVTILFESIDGLNSILPKDNAVSITRVGNETVFSQVLFDSADGELSDDSLDIYKDIFKDHYFRLKVSVPYDIIIVDNGVKSDNRVAVYQESFIDVISGSNKKEWNIRW